MDTFDHPAVETPRLQQREAGMLTELPLEGSVVALTADRNAYSSEHELATRAQIAWRVARLRKSRFEGEYDRTRSYEAPLYFVPSDTLVGSELIGSLGIVGPHCLFGGVVHEPFVRTKAIAHPVVDELAARPEGWNLDFAARVDGAVLDGFSAFTLHDAARAGRRLLLHGEARLKPVRATAGRGQVVVRDVEELDQALAAMDPDEIAGHGIVIEENLCSPVTFSVGQVHVGSHVASYYGVQRITDDNKGEAVYGGSDLTVARGDFEALLAISLPAGAHRAVEQARTFHQAVKASFAGFCASRINYDVAQGFNTSGQARSGVLEQSWRVGGATGAEIAALEIFEDQPSRNVVNASTFEIYGEGVVPPPNACVYFNSVDPVLGQLIKYTVVEP